MEFFLEIKIQKTAPLGLKQMKCMSKEAEVLKRVRKHSASDEQKKQDKRLSQSQDEEREISGEQGLGVFLVFRSEEEVDS